MDAPNKAEPVDWIEVVMLPVAALQKNDWNANRMGEEEFTRFVETVQRRRRAAQARHCE